MQRLTFLVLASLAVAIGGPAATAAEQSPKDDIASQIRAQGYQCDSPQSAEQDAQASKPDEAVWVLVCEDTTYRVRLIPDMAAQVERIGKNKNQESSD